jgi:cleavage and polyadenylation specificity factor subunit 2
MLICTDTAGRMLELAHFLDQLWKNENSGLFAYTIALLNNVIISTIELAKSQVEWMNERIVTAFETSRYNPFDFKHIKLCRSLEELGRLNTPSRNKLVLVSQSDLECGFARTLFAEWCENSNNTVIFTSRPSPNTLAHYLLASTNNKKSIDIQVNSFF